MADWQLLQANPRVISKKLFGKHRPILRAHSPLNSAETCSDTSCFALFSQPPCRPLPHIPFSG